MRKLVCVFISLVALTCPGKWANLPLDQLVSDSDVIVVGTLEKVKKHWGWRTDRYRGEIKVAETIWSNSSLTDRLSLKWETKKRYCPSVDHSRHTSKGIWLLTTGTNGVYRADYPWRFVDVTKKAEVEKLVETIKKRSDPRVSVRSVL